MREGNETGVRVARRGIGYSAEGPKFYVWDVEPRAVIDTALALTESAPKARVRKVVRLRSRRTRTR